MNGIKYQQRRDRLAKRRQWIKDLKAVPKSSYADVAEMVSAIEGKPISRQRVCQIVLDYERKPRRKA